MGTFVSEGFTYTSLLLTLIALGSVSLSFSALPGLDPVFFSCLQSPISVGGSLGQLGSSPVLRSCGWWFKLAFF